ncbi:MAG: hypothetical protein K2K16_09600 [Ruminococcus sp.]|nr:hypothetical protein [Ruminococcus sp.]
MHGMISVMAETASASGIFSSISADTFNPIIEEIKSVMPALLVVTVTLGGIRKAWLWLRSAIRGA